MTRLICIHLLRLLTFALGDPTMSSASFRRGCDVHREGWSVRHWSRAWMRKCCMAREFETERINLWMLHTKAACHLTNLKMQSHLAFAHQMPGPEVASCSYWNKLEPRTSGTFSFATPALYMYYSKPSCLSWLAFEVSLNSTNWTVNRGVQDWNWLRQLRPFWFCPLSDARLLVQVAPPANESMLVGSKQTTAEALRQVDLVAVW